MPAKKGRSIRRTSNEQPAKKEEREMSFDVMEWLEGERIEHERRMLELGFLPPAKKQSGPHKNRPSTQPPAEGR